MPRQRRMEYEGAFYHVLERGNRREPIIDGPDDADLFCKTPAEVCLKTGWRVHA
jgi:putative transposase